MLNFHAFRTVYDTVRQQHRNLDVNQYAKAVADSLENKRKRQAITQDQYDNQCSAVIMERSWINDRRPYYNVYPFVVDSLLRIKLEMTGIDVWQSILNLPCALAINFAVDREPNGLRSILYLRHSANSSEAKPQRVGHTKNTGNSLGILWDVGRQDDGYPIYNMIRFLCDERTVEQSIDADQYQGLNPTEIAVGKNAIRIVLSLAMMCDDPEIVQPIVLNADRGKYEQTGDGKYVEKAIRRGVHGWTVGRDIEFVPHVRRPHFGIRWMGHGDKKTPKIRPIKGSIVHREKVLEIPTGYAEGIDE